MQHYRTPFLVTALVLLATASAAQPAVALPDEAALTRPLATRAELLEAIDRLEKIPAPDERISAMKASGLRRLEFGDLRPGDLVLVEVPDEVALSDTFALDAAGELRLPSPTVGAISLKGLLRSEVVEAVTRHIARFVVVQGVRVRPLMRIAIEGEVVRAGYYAVPLDATLTDVLMAADGITRDADLRRVRIARDGRTFVDREGVRAAFAAGSTVDDAQLKEGDSIEVGRGRGMLEGRLRFTWLLVSLAGGVYGLSRAF